MKKTLILAALMAAVALTAASQTQTETCRGNFTGKGPETLIFTPVGYSVNNFIVDEDVPDVYRISGKYAPGFYFKGCWLTPAGVCDVDGDGRDELAFTTSGVHGCWGALIVMDFYEGQWHLLTTEGIPVYACSDDNLSNLISAGRNKSTFYAVTWDMISNSFTGKKMLYTINRRKYNSDINGYYDASHHFVNIRR